MKLDDLVRRADELLKLTNDVANSVTHMNDFGEKFVDTKRFSELRASGLSFLLRAFGDESPLYTEFEAHVKGTGLSSVKNAFGILTASRNELAGGWIFTTKGLVSAEVFNDFLSMAEHLLSEKYKDAAAVMIGSVLEEHLRQLCKKHSISTEVAKPDGSLVPLRASAMNVELTKAKVYTALDNRNVTAWLGYRNSAAHGKYTEYTDAQVDLMLQGVSDFIARVPL